MRTLVCQSFRTERVPAWVQSCMASVQDWARLRGHGYRFFDDALFSLVPDWFRDKAQGEVCPVTDLARLLLIKGLLAEEGIDAVAWVDADVLVFAPEALDVAIERDYAFCRETWVYPGPDGPMRCSLRVANAVTVFARENAQLDFFIDAALRIGRHQDRLGKLDIGTHFLSRLSGILPMTLLPTVGFFSPAVMAELAHGPAHAGDAALRTLGAHTLAPLACANLCASLSGQAHEGLALDDAAYERVIGRCLESRGAVVNRFRPGA